MQKKSKNINIQESEMTRSGDLIKFVLKRNEESSKEFRSAGTILIKNKLNPRICFEVSLSLQSKEVSQKYTVSKLSNELTAKKLLIVTLGTNLITVANFLLPLL